MRPCRQPSQACAVASAGRSARGRASSGLSCGWVMVTESASSRDRRTRTVGRAHPPPEGPASDLRLLAP